MKKVMTLIVILTLYACGKGTDNANIPGTSNDAQNSPEIAYTMDLSSIEIDLSLIESQYAIYAHEGKAFIEQLESAEVSITSENYFLFDKITGEIIGFTDEAPHYNIKEIIIPGTINGVPVTAIRSGAFSGIGLKRVVLPDSIQKIDDRAFESNDLEVINLPHNIREIGDYAFMGNVLTTIIVPDSVRKIDEGAFRHNAISEIYLGKGLQILGANVFNEESVEIIINESPLTLKDIAVALDMSSNDQSNIGQLARKPKPIFVTKKNN